ncbi:hypothetical protein GCM10010199_70580 [Dactylosporangium roseum]
MRLNGEEFGRVVRLIESALPTLTEARSAVQWQADAADLYRARMGEAESLAHELREGFLRASNAVLQYAEALAEAKTEMEIGDAANDGLRELIKEVANTQSKRVRDSEPLSQWEDLRKITSLFDRQVEEDYQDKINKMRVQADSLYYEAAGAYSRVRDIEQNARQIFVAEMHSAFKRLPDFKADSNAAKNIIKRAPGVLAEMNDAGLQNPESRLPGQGFVPRFGVDAPGDMTDFHQDIRDASGSFVVNEPAEWGVADAVHGKYIDPAHEQKYKLAWIRANQELIQGVAYQYGIPAELLAGIIYQEAGGKPPVLDHTADWVRRNTPLGGKDADDTSFGLMGIQVDTAAVALGYDPAHLTDSQRAEIIKSLDEPKESIVIAAKVLADAKDTTDCANTDPKQMTFDQQRELAARYNGGPDWNKEIAQSYADDFANSRTDVNLVLYAPD